jgi:hypothetical protein
LKFVKYFFTIFAKILKFGGMILKRIGRAKWQDGKTAIELPFSRLAF